MAFLLGAVVLVLDVFAVMNIVSSTMSGGQKVVWTLIVVLFPAVGVVVYLVYNQTRRQK
jgi:hypothetical protein